MVVWCRGRRIRAVIAMVCLMPLTALAARADAGPGPQLACPYATTSEVAALTGIGGLDLTQVIHPGDEVEGFMLTFLVCTWLNPSWSVSITVHRGLHVAGLYVDYLAELSDSPGIVVSRVDGPWDDAISWTLGTTGDYPASQVMARGGDLVIEVHLVGEAGPSAFPLARHVFERATMAVSIEHEEEDGDRPYLVESLPPVAEPAGVGPPSRLALRDTVATVISVPAMVRDTLAAVFTRFAEQAAATGTERTTVWAALTTWPEADLLALVSPGEGASTASSFQAFDQNTSQMLAGLAKVMRTLREVRNTAVRGML